MLRKLFFLTMMAVVSMLTACGDDDSDDTSNDQQGLIGRSWELDAGEASFWVRAYYGDLYGDFGAFLLHYKDGVLTSILPGGEWQMYIGSGDATKEYFVAPGPKEAFLYNENNEEIIIPCPATFNGYPVTQLWQGCFTKKRIYILSDYQGIMIFLRIKLSDYSVSTIGWPDGVDPYIDSIDCHENDLLAPFHENTYRLNEDIWEMLGDIPDHMKWGGFNDWIKDDGDKVWTLTYAPDSVPEYEEVPYGGLVPSLLGTLEDGVHTQIDVEGNRYVMMDRAAAGDLFLVRQTWGADADDVYRVHAAIVEYIDGEGFSSAMLLEGAADYNIAKDISSPSLDTVLVLTETRENIHAEGNPDDDLSDEKKMVWDSRGVIWVLEDGAFRKVEMPEELQDSKISWDSIHAVAP